MQTVAVLARAAVAVAFAVAAVAKLRDRGGFRRTLALSPLTRRATRGLGVAVPVVELAVAGSLVVPGLQEASGVAAGGLLGAFTAFLLLTNRLDDAGGCRCFGARGTSRRDGTLRNLLLLALLAIGSSGWTAPAAVAGFAGYALPARLFWGRPALRPESGELMLVFVEPGCGSCERLLAGWPAWPDADGVGRRVVDDPHVLDAYGITATPSAVVLDAAGRLVDGNHRPGAGPSVGPEAIERRWRLAVQGHDLPLPPDAERTRLLFLDRDDAAPVIDDGVPVIVLAARRLRRAPADARVVPDPGGGIRSLFDVKQTPATVLVDRRGRKLSTDSG